MTNKQILKPMSVSSADVIGQAVSLDTALGFALQAVWPGGIVGTLKLQGSNDGSVFSDVPNSTQAVASANSFLWNVDGAYYSFVRLYFTYNSGSGVITSNANTKGFL